MAQAIGNAGGRQRAFLGPHLPASTANTDHIHRKFLDVPYASLSPAHRLDIYLPEEGDGPFPVILSIHGGAFMECDKALGHFCSHPGYRSERDCRDEHSVSYQPAGPGAHSRDCASIAGGDQRCLGECIGQEFSPIGLVSMDLFDST